MAQNTTNQATGHIGEGRLQQMFKEQNYACSNISPDFGEDFFVFCQDGSYIEPFRIFVQSKASADIDYRASDWTVYCDPMTVRNWVLGNELTIIVRLNLNSGEARFSIPESDIDYWAIDFTKDVPIRLMNIFEYSTVEELVWRARIRHYDRIVRLVRPNEFEPSLQDDVPRYRKFVFEFLNRLRIFDASFKLTRSVRSDYNQLFILNAFVNDFESSENFTVHDQLRYSSCLQLLLQKLDEVSTGGVGLSKLFADDCACLLVQFIIDHEARREVCPAKEDRYYQSIRRELLEQFTGNQEFSPFLTKWYEGQIYPIRTGVYQRNYEGILYFSTWTGERWVDRSQCFDVFQCTDTLQQPQDLPWRGVASMSSDLEMAITSIAAICFDQEIGSAEI